MMSEIKGYVVRAEKGPHEYVGHEATLPEAVRDYETALRRYDTVRIFAVAEDGTETPLPTYEEALGQAIRAADLEAALEQAWVDIESLTKQRDAFDRCSDRWRTTADRYCNTIAERDAEIEALRAERDEAQTCDAISEEQTDVLWHAVEDATLGRDLAEPLQTLAVMGIDAGPVETVRDLRDALRTLFAAARGLLDAYETSYQASHTVARTSAARLRELDEASEEVRPLVESQGAAS